MTKIIKNKLINFLINCFIFLITVGWIFSGWPRIWQNPPIPPEIKEVKAAAVIKTYTFDASLENFSSTCGTNVICSRNTSDGSPGIGSLEENLVTKNQNRTWQWELSGITWESLGVPAGSTVNSVDGYYNHRAKTFTDGHTTGGNTSGDFTIRDSNGNLLMTLENSNIYTAATNWVTKDATGAINVPIGSQASNTSIRVRLNGNIRTLNVKEAQVTLQQDQILLVVDYTPPTITVGTIGSQVSSMNIPSTNQYVGGTFTFVRNLGNTNVTQIIISETDTVNANLNLSNINLYYETTASCSYEGNETLFGTTVSFDASEKATVSGSMTIGTSQVCVYLVLDVGSGTQEGETLEIEISNPSVDVTVSAGNVSPATPIAIAGTTTLTTIIPPATWKAAEDTPITGVNKNENIRLRIQIINTGGEAPDYDYLLEYAVKIGDSCGDDESFIALPIIAETQHFEMADSIYITNREPTTTQLTVPDSYNFVSGKMIENPSNSSGNLFLSFENYTEIEFVFQATNNAIDEGNYCFRLTNAGNILESYPVYPELQIASAP